MKGCFVLHRRFAYIGHYIALALKEEHGVAEFCGVACTHPSLDFLLKQKDIHYSTLLFDEEIHNRYKEEPLDPAYIEQLEQDYGLPSLWPYLAVDRVVMSNQLIREYPYNQPRYTHEEMQRLVQVYAKALTEFLDKEKPDFVFLGPIGSVNSYLLYQMAKKRGIKTFTLLMSSVRDHYIVSERYDTFTGVNARFADLYTTSVQSPARAAAEEFLQQFRDKPFPYFNKSTPAFQPTSRRKQLKFLNPVNALKSLNVFLHSIGDYITNPHQKDYSTISPFGYLKDLTMRKIRNARGANDLYDTFTPEQDDYAFFPLHYEPEISLLLQAPYQTDQLGLIRNIARSLPLHFKLYVKDHPEMAQYRPRSYYQELKKNPNVKLINPNVSSFAITPKAKLVTTITGTTGWEAVLLKIPVISFGHQFYNELSMVTYCDRIEELPTIIKDRLEHPKHNETELLAYLTALFEDSAELNLHHLWMDEPDFDKKKEGVRPVARVIAEKLGLL